MKIILTLSALAVILFLYVKKAPPTPSTVQPLSSTSNSAISNKHPVTILALGDSLTAGYNISKEDSYPQLLENMLNLSSKKFQIKVVNAGISGSTSSSALQRLKNHIQNLEQIDVLLLALGSNDGLRGVPIETLQNNLEQTIQLAKSHNIQVFLAGMKLPPSYGLSYQSKFNKLFKQVAKKHRLVFIPFLLQGVATKPQYNLSDGIHPNEEGHQIITQTILPYFTEFLNDRS